MVSVCSSRMTTPTKTPPGADPKQLERTGTVREIGSQAVWSLSSCKPGKPQTQHPDRILESTLVFLCCFSVIHEQVLEWIS